MKILSIHNYPGNYAQGGEGNVFEAEADLLRQHGHEVRQYKCTNAEVEEGSLLTKISAFIQAPWSKYGYEEIRYQIADFEPDIVHVHNFFFILSPSIFRAAKDAGIAIVTTLHNYRLLSPCSQFLRNNQICEICLGRNPWRIMLYRCYRNSFLASLLRYRIYYWSKKKYNWIDDIDAFIVLTDFGKRKFIEGGLPMNRLYVKPNFISDSLLNGQGPKLSRHGALFIGRLSQEKGLKILLEAWRAIDYPLTILGDGPLKVELQSMAPENVIFRGEVSRKETADVLGAAAFIIVPSIWYEGFPLVVLEAYACGTSIVASRLGGLDEVVIEGKTGLKFEPGNIDDLRKKINELIGNPSLAEEMGNEGRAAYLRKYSPESNYEMLVSIYENVIRNKHRFSS